MYTHYTTHKAQDGSYYLVPKGSTKAVGAIKAYENGYLALNLEAEVEQYVDTWVEATDVAVPGWEVVDEAV